MGRRKRDQGKLFYDFRLEDRIPDNHLVRRMNAFVGVALADLHKELEPHYSDIGRPSVDPELMIRMLIVGYCYGIRSERRLVQEVDLRPVLLNKMISRSIAGPWVTAGDLAIPRKWPDGSESNQIPLSASAMP